MLDSPTLQGCHRFHTDAFPTPHSHVSALSGVTGSRLSFPPNRIDHPTGGPVSPVYDFFFAFRLRFGLGGSSMISSRSPGVTSKARQSFSIVSNPGL